MEPRIRIHVLGLSYSQLQSGAYALILAEDRGPRRIPIIIGAAEAQSIAVALEAIHTPRPLTHDLFVSFAHAFGVKLTEVFIYKFEDGIFSSELTFSDGERTISIDSRTSDAIAIAMRTGAPIYTTQAILSETGFEMEITEEAPDDGASSADEADDDNRSEPKLENYTIEELEKTLARLIDREEYEEAARVSEILKRKRGEA